MYVVRTVYMLLLLLLLLLLLMVVMMMTGVCAGSGADDGCRRRREAMVVLPPEPEDAHQMVSGLVNHLTLPTDKPCQRELALGGAPVRTETTLLLTIEPPTSTHSATQPLYSQPPAPAHRITDHSATHYGHRIIPNYLPQPIRANQKT